MDKGPRDRLDGIILAGGKSRRLGTDKTRLRMGNRRLIDVVLETVRVVADSIVIVTNSPQLFGGVPARITTDVQPGAGSLGGILSGLLLAEHEHSLVVACDMPFLNADLLKYMVQEIDNHDLVMPRMEDNFEPLHAIYSRRCIEPIRRLLAVQDFKITDLIHEVDVRLIERGEIDLFDPSHLSFFNINTPEDLDRARVEYDRRCGQR